MQEIHLFLDKVLVGDEQAFRDFCLARINISWQFMDTLRYFHEKASRMPEKLDKCYPEIFLELIVFLGKSYAALKNDPSVVSFLSLLKHAAKNNDTAKYAVLVMRKIDHSILNTEEFKEICEQLNNIQKVAEPNKHQLYLYGLFEKARNITPLSLVKAAALGHGHAMNKLGETFESRDIIKDLSEKNRYVKAFEWYSQAAALGNPHAVRNLACLYQLGKDGQDLSDVVRCVKAIEWYSQAAALGDPVAMNMLGVMFDKGIAGKDLPEDERNKKAYMLYEKAASLGIVDAMFNIACMYMRYKIGKDLGEKAMLMKAKEWFQQALQTASSDLMIEINIGLQEIAQKLAQLNASQVVWTRQEFQQFETTVERLSKQVQKDLLRAKDQTIKQLQNKNHRITSRPSAVANTLTFYKPFEAFVMVAADELHDIDGKNDVSLEDETHVNKRYKSIPGSNVNLGG